MAKYLVTGGAGFIGSNITKKLVDLKKEVVVFDNFSTGTIDNLKSIKNKIRIIKGDLGNFSEVKKAVKNIDYIIHHGAISSVQQSINNPYKTNETNVTGTLNILICAKESNIKRVVFAGSASAYGNEKTIPKKETTKLSPQSPYGLHKLFGEEYCKLFSSLYGLDTVTFRYFNVFGPNQSSKSDYATVIPIFVTKMLKGKPPIIYGDGKQTRDFIFIDNVVNANLSALHSKKRFNGKIFNIAAGKRYNLLDLVNNLNKILNKNYTPIFDKPRKGEVRHSLADISRARKHLGYKLVVGFYKGLEKTVEWYRK